MLGTDGFGRSDYRRKLRRFFEVDRHYVAVAALKALADEGTVEPAKVQEAIDRYESWRTGPRRSMSDVATQAVEVKVPDIGDFADVPVIEVHVAPGDAVMPEDPLVTLESDKATMDVPSPLEGVVAELKVGVGDTVSEGT